MTSLDHYIAALNDYNRLRTIADALLAELKAAERRHKDACAESVAAYDRLKTAKAHWETEALGLKGSVEP